MDEVVEQEQQYVDIHPLKKGKRALLFLGDFFIQMFRGTRPMTLEYFIPMHNSLALMSETYLAQEKLWHVIVAVLINILVALIVMRSTYKKEGLYDKRKRRS